MRFWAKNKNMAYMAPFSGTIPVFCECREPKTNIAMENIGKSPCY
jgi:hypothetical protein